IFSASDLAWHLRQACVGPTLERRELRANHLGDPNDLEDSEDRRSAGGHGNQHVRLRGAQIGAPKRSARLAAICREPRQTFRFRLATTGKTEAFSSQQFSSESVRREVPGL